MLGLYLHGLLEQPAVLHALFGSAPVSLDTVFERAADFVDEYFGAPVLRGLLD